MAKYVAAQNVEREQRGDGPLQLPYERMLAYVVPQDGKGPGDTKAFFTSFIICESVEQRELILKNIEWSLAAERIQPTIYRNKYRPEITWSNMAFSVPILTINFRSDPWDAEAPCSLTVKDFCYSQVNRQHDWHINLYGETLDFRHASKGVEHLHVNLVMPPNKVLLHYLIVHTVKSPLAATFGEGVPHWGGEVFIDKADVTVDKVGFNEEAMSFLNQLGRQFGDGHYLMWPATYIERGGVQYPLDALYISPWKYAVNSLCLRFLEDTKPVLKASVAGFVFRQVYKLFDYYSYEAQVKSISAIDESDGRTILTSGDDSNSACEFLYRVDQNFDVWKAENAANIASKMSVRTAAIQAMLPAAPDVAKLQAYFKFGESVAGKPLYPRCNRAAGCWEAQRQAELAKSRTDAVAEYPQCSHYGVEAGKLAIFVPQRKYKGADEASPPGIHAAVGHVSVSTALDDAFMCLDLTGKVSDVALECTLKDAERVSVLKEFGINATFSNLVPRRTGWVGGVEVTQIQGQCLQTAYAVIIHTARSFTEPPQDKTPSPHSPFAKLPGATE